MADKLVEQFIRYRAINNLTQQDVANKIGSDRAVIIRFEQGKSISKTNQVKILLLLEEQLKKGGK